MQNHDELTEYCSVARKFRDTKFFVKRFHGFTELLPGRKAITRRYTTTLDSFNHDVAVGNTL